MHIYFDEYNFLENTELYQVKRTLRPGSILEEDRGIYRMHCSQEGMHVVTITSPIRDCVVEICIG